MNRTVSKKVNFVAPFVARVPLVARLLPFTVCNTNLKSFTNRKSGESISKIRRFLFVPKVTATSRASRGVVWVKPIYFEWRLSRAQVE